ncbi:MAG: metallophosphoesterase family protein [Candidatus Hydrothermarchaeota archaeon]
MKIGLISDIHGNLEALNAVMEKLKADKIISLGDTVGYGPNPNECIDILKDNSVISLLGNHDAASLGKMNIEWFNPVAKEAILWTMNELTEDSKNFLENLGMMIEEDDFLFVHGSPVPLGPSSSTHYIEDYLLSIQDAVLVFSKTNKNVFFVGHTHVAQAFIYSEGKITQKYLTYGGKISLSEGRYIANPGSIGQPRDGNPYASYGVIDTDENTVEVRRVPYEIEKTTKKMKQAGLPRMLYERLFLGY